MALPCFTREEYEAQQREISRLKEEVEKAVELLRREMKEEVERMRYDALVPFVQDREKEKENARLKEEVERLRDGRMGNRAGFEHLKEAERENADLRGKLEICRKNYQVCNADREKAEGRVKELEEEKRQGQGWGSGYAALASLVRAEKKIAQLEKALGACGEWAVRAGYDEIGKKMISQAKGGDQ